VKKDSGRKMIVTAVKTRMALFWLSATTASSFCSMDRSWKSCSRVSGANTRLRRGTNGVHGQLEVGKQLFTGIVLLLHHHDSPRGARLSRHALRVVGLLAGHDVVAFELAAVALQALEELDFLGEDEAHGSELVDAGEVFADKQHGFVASPGVVAAAFLVRGSYVSWLLLRGWGAPYQVLHDVLVGRYDGCGVVALPVGVGGYSDFRYQVD
jgi:hypothetical protein